eukprot:COSAG05_NODE_6298_length_984_cov_0.772009_3_plen_50_part_01
MAPLVAALSTFQPATEHTKRYCSLPDPAHPSQFQELYFVEELDQGGRLNS